MRIDLMVQPVENFEKFIDVVHRLGIRVIGVSKDLVPEIEKYSRTKNVKVVPRVIVDVSKSKIPRHVLTLRNCIVGFRPLDALSARRIPILVRRSIIIFDGSNIKFLDDSEAHLIAENECTVEFSLRELLSTERNRDFYIRRAAKFMELIQKYSLRVVFSSFAKYWWELWHPRSLYALLRSLRLPRDYIRRSMILSQEYVMRVLS